MGKITKKRNDLKFCNDLYVSTEYLTGREIVGDNLYYRCFPLNSKFAVKTM